MTARRMIELTPAQRRLAVVRSVLREGLTVALLLVVYYQAPLSGRVTSRALQGLGVGLFAFAVMLLWQVHSVRAAKLPEMRAVEALLVAVPLFLVIFAAVYLSLSAATPSAFTEPLTHTTALYFTITTFATVGFGDITAHSDGVRAIVSVQMLLDLVVLGGLVRLLFRAARTGLSRGEYADPEHR